MAKICLSIVLAVLSVTAALAMNQTEPKFCHSSYRIYHVCLGLPYERPLESAKPTRILTDFFWIRENKEDESAEKCVSLFCADGSEAEDKYCGVGPCGPFGYNCVGGCRKGNGTDYETLQTAWIEKQGLVTKARHEFNERVIQFE